MMSRIARRSAVLLYGAICLGMPPRAAAAEDFNRVIRPILSDHCFACHGADSSARKAKLRLDDRQSALENRAFVPGKPDESELIKRIFSHDSEEQMPPPSVKRPLSETQKLQLRNWIAGGAPYAAHWAFIPPQRHALPRVAHPQWPRNAIDYFVLASLETRQLKPSPPAPIGKLLRRMSLDLTGLPAEQAQIQRWSRFADPVEAAADELLSSPHFGERMASDWMDVARFADTHGFNNDSARVMWRWRDWVIAAFNRNLPYNEFITTQLAGDLLPSPTLEQMIATGFNRNHVISSEGGIIDEEYRVEYVADRVNTTSLAWLGLTMICARCHDHKFDPISQRDFYRLFAFFNNVDEHGEDGRIANAAPLLRAPTDEQQRRQRELTAELELKANAMERPSRRFPWKTYKTSPSSNPHPTASTFQTTNLIIAFDLTSLGKSSMTLSNVAGGTPFHFRAPITATTNEGPGDRGVIRFDGGASLRTDALPKNSSSKGWAFSSWLNRENTNEVVVFSTADFSLPPSSGSYGQGVEVRLTAQGAIDLRAIRRWPAYSANIVTKDFLPYRQWSHVLVICEKSGKAADLRVYIDGEECLSDVVHDGIEGITGLSGATLLGASKDARSSAFKGELADLRLYSQPFDSELVAREVRAELGHQAAGFILQRKAIPTAAMRDAWLEAQSSEFARVKAQWRVSKAALIALERSAPSTMVMRELASPRTTHVLIRGQYDKPGEAITPGVPEFLLPFPKEAPRSRVGLAQWLTHPNHPLTSRVVVNRMWHSLFGTGLVKSVEDFGLQSDPPSHPELLDWLAIKFVEGGWDVKKLLRLLVTSATYGQDTRSTDALNELDPENRSLTRGPRQRLTAEMLRDQALAIGGLLETSIGGPPAFPYQPENLYKGIVVAADYPGTSYTASKGRDGFRRSLYTFWKRTVPHPTMATFDAPDRETCVGRRLRTNTPLQALALMNDRVHLQAAHGLALRMLLEGGLQEKDRIRFGFRRATTREPESYELDRLTTLLRERMTYYTQNNDSAKAYVAAGAGVQSAPEEIPAPDLAAYANIASLILNLDETITRD